MREGKVNEYDREVEVGEEGGEEHDRKVVDMFEGEAKLSNKDEL